MFYDPLSVSNEEENAQNILCINDHRQWASPMFTINVNQALAVRALHRNRRVIIIHCIILFPFYIESTYIILFYRAFLPGVIMFN
jgi:hypothetical protein